MKNLQFLFVLVVLFAMQMQILRRPTVIEQPAPQSQIIREVAPTNHYDQAIRHGRQIIIPAMRELTGYSACSSTIVDVSSITTSRHCFNEYMPEVGQVIMIENQPATIMAFVLGEEKRDQVAIRLNRTFPSWARITNDRPQVGARVFMLGNPGGLPNIFREGYVTNHDGRWNRLDLNVTKGDSGSGIFDSQGRLFGSLEQVSDKPLNHVAAFMGYKFDPVKLRTAGITLHY